MDSQRIDDNNNDVESKIKFDDNLGPSAEFDNKLKDALEEKTDVMAEFMRELEHVMGKFGRKHLSRNPIEVEEELKCPKCEDGFMIVNTSYVLTSMPPRYTCKCNKCGAIDYTDRWNNVRIGRQSKEDMDANI